MTRCENPFGLAIKIKFLIAKHLSSLFSWCIAVEATSKQFFMWFGNKSCHHPLPRFLQLGRSLPKPFSSDHQLPTITRCANSNRPLWSLILRLQSLRCFESTWVPAKQRLRYYLDRLHRAFYLFLQFISRECLCKSLLESALEIKVNNILPSRIIPTSRLPQLLDIHICFEYTWPLHNYSLRALWTFWEHAGANKVADFFFLW